MTRAIQCNLLFHRRFIRFFSEPQQATTDTVKETIFRINSLALAHASRRRGRDRDEHDAVW